MSQPNQCRNGHTGWMAQYVQYDSRRGKHYRVWRCQECSRLRHRLPPSQPRRFDGHPKLTPDQVARIRAELATGPRGTAKRLADELGVGKSCISEIKHGRNWNGVRKHDPEKRD